MLILLVFGSLIAGFGVYVATAQQNAVRDGVRAYAEDLAARGVAEIKNTLGESSATLYDSPEYYFALYTVTGGNVMIETADEFIDVNRPRSAAASVRTAGKRLRDIGSKPTPRRCPRPTALRNRLTM